MSRVIKFRAWFGGKMLDVFAVNPMNHTVYLSCLQLNGREGADVLVPWNDYVETEGCDLMQFTGLKDKNGKDIYEGDVVKLPKYSKGFTAEVRYSDYYTGFVPFVEMAIREQSDCEVIGNIYENAELVEAK